MIRHTTLLIAFALSACQTTQINEPVAKQEPPIVVPQSYQTFTVNSDDQIWISEQYKPVDLSNSDIHLYIKERRAWLPEYFLIINTNKDNGHHLVGAEGQGWTDLSTKEVSLADKELTHVVGHFDLLKSPLGEYIKLINETPYSAPKCGVVSEYISKDKNYSISLVDPISCGQFSLVLRGEEMLDSMSAGDRMFMEPYISTLDQQLETLKTEDRSGFGFL